ncbi:polysaccharide deacetylase family protein [Streptomyces longwoodensis]|uniref:polysaccharide deacetylase family protein n=1 Tax=Streptomyces longwoodensis TaxID=68231 RepID=UPI0036E77CA7
MTDPMDRHATPSVPPSRSPGHGTRALLALLAALLVAGPFVAAWHLDTAIRAVSAQESPPGTASTPATTPGAGTAVRQGPVVLAYHDIAPQSRSRYAVTPEVFEAQIAALARAGYRSLSSDEFLAYLRDGRTPAPRSVLLTFDDGTHGLWVHADRILAKYRMRAAAFLITGQVGRHRPYYLSWAEIERMHRSGRWDFQDHTHDLHHRAAANRRGRQVPALAHRLWLSGPGRGETAREYHERVERDLDRSLGEFAGHGLPRPRLFAFPFSEAALPARRTAADTGGSGARDRADRRFLVRALRARFAVRFTNVSGRPLPAGPRAAAEGQVQRLEVTRATGAADLLAAVARWAPVPPSACPAPLTEPEQWERTDGRPGAALAALTGTGRRPGGAGYASAAYRPMSSADWTGYTVRVTVDRLRGQDNSVALVVSDRSRDPVTVSLGHGLVRVLAGVGDGRREIARRAVQPGPSHRLTVTVGRDRTVVLVDGSGPIEHRAPRLRRGEATGGIAFSTRTGRTGVPFPRLTALTVAPAASPEGHR